MANFVKGSALNSAIEALFEDAQQTIVIISPYIKLHSRFIEILKTKKNHPSIQIIVVFGKNEDDLSKSIYKDDVEFLSNFPNITIKYEPRLHAKYYSNEKTSILSSMNLYDFSQNNNIEFGIVTSTNKSSKLDSEAFDYFSTVISNAECIYKKTPNFESKLMGFSKKYVNSTVNVDNLEKLGKQIYTSKGNNTKFNESHTKKSSWNEPKQEYSSSNQHFGFCIRTGEKIKFDLERPLSNEAFKIWNLFGDEEYPENYCHYSGERSDGETCYARPVLYKNWNKVKM